jgi:ribose transport system substrate-binding protein
MEKRRKQLILTIISIVLLIAFTASCSNGSGGSSTEESADTSTDTAQTESASDETATDGNGGFLIGFSNYSLANSWRVQFEAEFQYVADQMKEEGVISDYIMTNANNDVTKQIGDIQDLITKGVDAIIVTAMNPDSINPVLEEAMDKGIVVVNFDQIVSTDKITSKITYDEVEYGKICGEFIKEALDGKGKIVSLRFTAGTSTDNNRQQGFEEGIAGSDIEIVAEAYTDCDYAKSKTAIESIMAANPEIDGVWAMGGASAQAVVDAFNEKGRELVPTTGEGSNGFLKVWLKEKDKLLSVAPCAPTFCSAEALRVAVDALNGNEVEKNVVIPLPVITQDTLEDYVKPDLPDSYWCYTELPDSISAELFSQ